MNTIFKIIFITILSLILILLLADQSVYAQDIEPTPENEDTEVVPDEMTEQEMEEFDDKESDVNTDSTYSETEVEDISTLNDDLLLDAEEADEQWRMWMESDDLGERPYWFRHSFEILDPPSSGRLFITSDDNYNLYINGKYIVADDYEEIDWMEVHEHNIAEWLVVGKNTIAIEAVDTDGTRQGLVVALEYSTVPDINTQLDRMVDRELEKQEAARDELSKREAARETLRESQLTPPTEQELKDMRSQEKNKLD